MTRFFSKKCIIDLSPIFYYESTIEWLSKHDVPYQSFTIVDKYSRPNMDKNIAVSLDKLSNMAFHLAVEDSGEMAKFLSTEMNTPVALLDRPWNRDIASDAQLTRYSSWRELNSGFESMGS